MGAADARLLAQADGEPVRLARHPSVVSRLSRWHGRLEARVRQGVLVRPPSVGGGDGGAAG